MMIGSFPLMGWGKRSRKQKMEDYYYHQDDCRKMLFLSASLSFVLISHYCRGGPIKRNEEEEALSLMSAFAVDVVLYFFPRTTTTVVLKMIQSTSHVELELRRFVPVVGNSKDL